MAQRAVAQDSSSLELQTLDRDPPSIDRLIDLGLLDQARSRLRELVAAEGPTARTLLLEAMILRRQGRFADSLRKTQESIEAEPGHADSLKLFGLNLVSLGKGKLAEPYFATAAELSPDDSMARYYLGLFYLTERKDFTSAESELSRAVELDPESVDALCMLGLAREELGRTEAAVETYRRSIEANHERRAPNACGYLYLGRLFNFHERQAEALPLLKTAAEIDEDSSEAHLALGEALARSGQDAAALESLGRAAELAPGDAAPHYQMMRIYQRLGRPEDAAREAETFSRIEAAVKSETKKDSRTELLDRP